jgi:transketolase
VRNAFIESLMDEAGRRENVFLVVGDLGFSVVEPFAQKFPGRYLNAGVAEQNMTGVAAGLSRCGYNVFTYSIANFPTLRCLEQIRNDVCYHRANVKVVSVGAGLAYGALGYSHHAVQDLACLRSMPGMLMATPCDPHEARAAVRFLCDYDGPAYLRLGKAGEKVLHDAPLVLQAPALPRLCDGDGVAILACGSLADVALEAAPQLGAAVYSAALWRDDPQTGETIAHLVRSHCRVIVVEEHLPAGGFGSFVREQLEPWPDLQSRVRCLALRSAVCDKVGSQQFLRRQSDLTPEAIVRAAA